MPARKCLAILLGCLQLAKLKPPRPALSLSNEGEFAAAMELRRIFPLITDNGKAREFARIIAGWQPIVLPATRGGRPIRAKTHAKEGP